MFYDRKEEQKKINRQLKKIAQGKRIAITVEGKRGVGKTDLMRKCIKKYRDVAFKFASLDYIYKCNEDDSDREFAFVSDLLASLQNQQGRNFNKALIDGLDGIMPTSLRESAAKLIPQIPGLLPLEGLLEYSMKNIERTKNTVSDILIKKQLIICFSNMICKLLSGQYIIICIDDISWMDNYSFEVLKSILLRDDKNCFISIFVTSRRTIDMPEPYSKRYTQFEDVLKSGAYDEKDILSITLHNFDIDLFREIVKKHNRDIICNNATLLHKITNGNPLEIINFFKSSDVEITDIINDYKNNSEIKDETYLFTNERNINLFNSGIYNGTILSVMAVYGMPISCEILSLCVKEMVECIFCKSYSEVEYIKAMDELVDSELIHHGSTILFCHDSSREIIIDYIKTNGDFFDVTKCVATSLSNARNTESEYVCEILRLYSESDYVEGFRYYKSLNESTKNNLNVIKAGTLCFEKCISVLSESDIVNYGINLFLVHMYQGAMLDETKHLAHILLRFENNISKDSLYTLMSVYTKVLIDLGIFVGDFSANNIYKKLTMLTNSDVQKKLEVEIIGMTLYEHQGKFEMIHSCFNRAEDLVNNNDYPPTILSRFYRDKGLVSFHADLFEDYDYAIKLAKSISEDNGKEMLLGTCYNNRGLAAFYNGDINSARIYFEEARNHLQTSGYEILRPLNNLACCDIVLKKYEHANIVLSEALAQPFSGSFEISSAKMNRALVLYALGDRDGAEHILQSYFDEYISGELKQDGWIYANCLMNKAYICYSSKKYEDAAYLYHESNFYLSRFKPDIEQKRRSELEKKCRNHIQLINRPKKEFDFFDTPFVLSLLAYYII